MGPGVSLPRHPALQPSTAHLSQVGDAPGAVPSGRTDTGGLPGTPCVVPIVDPGMGRMGDKGCKG